MLFNSLDFAIFFPLVFIGYWFVFNKKLSVQNLFLLVASYFFYACWDWRFLALLGFSTLINFYLAQLIAYATQEKKKKALLVTVLLINLLLLGYFKYYGFFTQSFADAFSLFGVHFNVTSYSIILPLGISFYTFQNISYLVDVYRGKTAPSHNLLSFALFIAFFPQLIAGPIERTGHLMPQITERRVFVYKYAVNGMRLILLGLFEKMVIADNCAGIVNTVYNNFESHSGSTLFFAAVVYSFQIYGDFSGYSHIAIGCAALLGFHLFHNFNYPYLAKNIADFWRRWHISFSAWLRDYIYFPLGGSKKGNFVQMRNLTIVFVVSGIWHGANRTFIIYGFIHALLYILFVYYRRWIDNGERSTAIGDFAAMCGTFVALTLARVFFRAESVGDALHYFERIFSASLFTKPDMSRLFILLLFVFLFLEWLQREKKHLLDLSFIKQAYIRYSIYLTIFFMILYYSGQSQTFIYFQF